MIQIQTILAFLISLSELQFIMSLRLHHHYQKKLEW